MTETLNSEITDKPHAAASLFFEDWRAPALLLCACICLFFVRLGNFGLLEGGESYYPAAVREMVESGDLIVPHLNYQIYFSKPILTFWLIASAYYTFGVSEWSGRIWSAILSTVLVFCTYWTVRRLCSARAGLLAGLILASSPLLIATCRRSSVDIFFSCFLGISICATIMVLFAKQEKWWPLLYISLALAVLTKGPAALVLFGFGMALFLSVKKPGYAAVWSRLKQLRILPGMAIFSIISIPWFILVGTATHWLFLKVFIFYENLARFFGHTNSKHAHIWWYLITPIWGLFPWSLFLPTSLCVIVKQGFNRSPLNTDFDTEYGAIGNTNSNDSYDGLLFAAMCASAILILFSLSRTQFETYVLPAWCPLAIVLAGWLDSAIVRVEEHKSASWLKPISLAIAVAGALIPIAAIGAFAVKTELPRLSAAAAAIASFILAFCWIAQFRFLRTGQATKAVFTLAFGTAIAYAILTPVAIESWYRRSFLDVHELVRSISTPNAEVAQFRDFMPSLLYYRKGPVNFFYHIEDLVPKASANNGPEQLFVIVKQPFESELLGQKDLDFKLAMSKGEWRLYQSKHALLRVAPTLEATFKRLTISDLLTDKYQWGPLTMPYSGGKFWRTK